MSQINPIADLTYRSYDGPLNPPTRIWWVIARTMTLQVFKRKPYWIGTVLSGWYFLVMLTIIFVLETLGGAAAERGGSELNRFISTINWRDTMLIGFSFGQLIYMLIALLIGAGSIANDNRANALLVYLSKPCTRLDYVVGKFVGMLIPLFISMALPTTVFFLYGSLSYRGYGFLKEPLAYPSLLFGILISAILHTALVLGISSLFKQGRLAGVLYAGIYLVANLFTQLMKAVYISDQNLVYVASRALFGGMIESEIAMRNPIVKLLFYGSIDGLSIGISKAIMGTDGSAPFDGQSRIPQVPAPPTFPMILIIGGLVVAGVAIFYRKVKAVEVIG